VQLSKKEKLHKMNFQLKLDPLGKTEKKGDTEKDMYYFTFKTYNATIEGKFERSEIRHMIQILDNAI
jgi:hypothetical protein